jgi:hypothetical protein
MLTGHNFYQPRTTYVSRRPKFTTGFAVEKNVIIVSYKSSTKMLVVPQEGDEFRSIFAL